MELDDNSKSLFVYTILPYHIYTCIMYVCVLGRHNRLSSSLRMAMSRRVLSSALKACKPKASNFTTRKLSSSRETVVSSMAQFQAISKATNEAELTAAKVKNTTHETFFQMKYPSYPLACNFIYIESISTVFTSLL